MQTLLYSLFVLLMLLQVHEKKKQRSRESLTQTEINMIDVRTLLMVFSIHTSLHLNSDVCLEERGILTELSLCYGIVLHIAQS